MRMYGYTQEKYAQLVEETRIVPQHIVVDKRQFYASSSEVLLAPHFMRSCAG